MKEKAIRWPQHKTGKQCGYQLYEDGSIEVAPSYSEIMEKAEMEQRGINSLVAALNENLAKQLQTVERSRKIFWDLVKDDYGLDFDKFEYSYHAHSRKISKNPKEEAKK